MSQPQCTAKSKRSQIRCRHYAMMGKTVCYMHGGKALQGVAHPNFKSGKYSTYLPTRLVGQYETALADPNLRSMFSEIALADVQINELLKQFETGESGAAWRELLDAVHLFYKARTMSDTQGPKVAADAMNRIDAVARLGVGQRALQSELQEWMDTRRRLVESENAALGAAQQLVTVERVLILVGALAATIRTHVTDRPTLAKIQEDFSRLLPASVQGKVRALSTPCPALVPDAVSASIPGPVVPDEDGHGS